ncbi:MAG: hypothetical protein ABEJ70_04080 [Halobacteriaceae archaeon]
MPGWECGIRGCGRAYADLESMLAHQVTDHERHECAVCGAVVPDGFFAIKHAFEQHTRAEYVRNYDADAEDIRVRERVKSRVESQVDVGRLRERFDVSANSD